MKKLGPSVIICGSRDLEPLRAQLSALMEAVLYGDSPAPTEILSGACTGVDAAGEAWAADHHVPVRRFPADWGRFGKAAGPRRSAEMAAEADALIAIMHPGSNGTSDCIRRAQKKGIPCAVLVVPRKGGGRG